MKEWRASSTDSQMIPNLGERQPHRMLRGRAAIEGSRQKWAARNLMRFDKGKCEVLHLRQKTPTYLLDSELSLSQQHALEVNKSNCILGSISKNVGRMLRRWFFPPLFSTSGTASEVLCPILASPVQKKMLTYWSESS